MQINIDLQISKFLLLHYGSLGYVNSRLLFWARVQVKSVQVMIVCIQSVIPTSHTIWVQKRNDLELVFFEQQPGLLSFLHQKVNDTV